MAELVDHVAKPARQSEDWDALERQAGSADEREWRRWVRILESLASSRVLNRRAQVGPDVVETAPPPDLHLDSAPPIGQWGKYVLREKVGEGNYGSVFRAWDPDLEVDVAIKVLHRRVADDRLRQALLHEGRALARIAHPNVVRVLSVESHADQMALRMEFVHGETLENVLDRNGTLSAGEASLIGEDVCRALAAVHLAGYVHRDVKTRNVMREQAGRIVLMDFGAGHHAGDLQVPGKVANVGTPLYMAPEVFAGDPATPTSDVYSVGVLLYNLVTGRYPVEGRTSEDLRKAHLQGRRRALTERRADLPTPFVRIVEKALSPDPERRYANAGVLLAALSEASTASDDLRTIARWLGAAAGGGLTLTLLGALTTSAYNVTLGRTAPFNEASLEVFVEMGLRSLVSPAFWGGGMLLLSWVAWFYASASVRRLGKGRFGPTVARVTAVGTALGLNEPSGRAQALSIAGVLSLALIIWNYRELLDACVTVGLVNAPAEKLALVEPGHVGPFYRLWLDAVIVMCLLGLGYLRRARMAGWAHRRSAMMPVAGVLVFALLLSVAPWRILGHNKAERLEVNGERCYVMGEANGMAQVFCPDREPPRTRIVRLSAPEVVHTGVVESLFTAAR